jgi:polyisoprenoid-binding protein YceI
MRTSFRLIAILAAVCFAAPNLAANEVYKFDSAHSNIGFKVHQFFNTTTGKFSRFSGTIEIDREHLESSSVVARIEAKSINTNIEKRDNHLRSPEFFNVEKYPEITFKSRSAKKTGPQSGDVMGDFTMHGVTKPVTLHVQLVGDPSGARSHWKVTMEPIKRRDFGLMFNGTTEAISGIAQDVTVNIEIEAVRSN